jgi:hypothetical protein
VNCGKLLYRSSECYVKTSKFGYRMQNELMENPSDSGTIDELHMRPLGDWMINFELRDLLVSLHNPPMIFYCIPNVVQLVQ